MQDTERAAERKTDAKHIAPVLTRVNEDRL